MTEAADAPFAPNKPAIDMPTEFTAEEYDRLTDDIVAALKSVYDPEIPADIYELGLIYAIEICDDGAVKVEMTLTAPGCPSAQELPEQVRNAALMVPAWPGRPMFFMSATSDSMWAA